MTDELEPITRSDGGPRRAPGWVPALGGAVALAVLVAVVVSGGRDDTPVPVAELTTTAWRAEVGDPSEAADAVVTPPVEDVQRLQDGWLVTTSLDLVRLSRAGEPVWSRAWRGAPPVVVDGRFQAVDGRSLLTLDADTGAIVARAELADPVPSPTGMVTAWPVGVAAGDAAGARGLLDGYVAVASRGQVRVLDQGGATVLAVPSGGAIAGVGAHLVVVDRGRDVVALDPAAADADRAVVWRVDTPDRPRPDLVRLSPDGALVVHGHLGGVTAHDTVSGAVRWAWRPAAGTDLDARVVGVGGEQVRVEVRPVDGPEEPDLVTLDLATGAPDERAANTAPPAPALPDGATVPAFVPAAPPARGLPDGTVVTTVGQLVLGVRDGEARWRVDADARDVSLAVDGATTVVSGASTRALDASGATRWEDDLGDRVAVLAAVDGTAVSLVPGEGAPPTVVATAVGSGRERGRAALPVDGTVAGHVWDGRWLTLLVRRAPDQAGVLVGIELTEAGLVARWEAPAPGVTDLVGTGGTVVVAGPSHARRVDPTSGPVGEVTLDTLATPGRFAAADGVLVWVAGRGVVVTDLATGAETARVTLPAEPSTAPTVGDGLVLVPTVGGALERLALGEEPRLLAPVELGALPAAAPVWVGADAIVVRTRTTVLVIRAGRQP